MKIVVIGGAGVFGSRLVQMLQRDGHDVVVAGRRAGNALRLDRAGDLAPLWALAPDAVVDAAGPFHAYGDDPYRLPRAAIAQGVHYLDLADDAAFCAGISALDGDARAAGVVVVSGASSVPGLSSVVVAALAAGAQVQQIETAILPGNRAPRGRAVVDSILHQAGLPIAVRIAGQTRHIRSWSDPRVFDLGQRIRRRGFAIRVPDQSLFPAFFGASTVTFHAGLELWVMGWGLAAMAWLRARTGITLPVAWVHRMAVLLDRFGTDVGGMVVRVVTDRETAIWRMVVGHGEGPFVPGVMARAILRHVDDAAPGAGPALACVTLDQATAALSDLAVTTQVTRSPHDPLFPRVLGTAFGDLPATVRDSHAVNAPLRLSGRARITRGAGWYPRLIAWLFRFPPASDDTPVTVTKTPRDGGEIWVRQFGKHRFHSELRAGKAGMTERFGAFTFDLDLHIAAHALQFPVKAGRFLGMPVPRWCLPASVASETARDGVFRFDVALHAPLTGQLVVHYRGWLARNAESGKKRM